MEKFDTFQKAKLPSSICFLEVLLFILGYFIKRWIKVSRNKVEKNSRKLTTEGEAQYIP